MPPPSWANSATKLAPKPNPTIRYGTGDDKEARYGTATQCHRHGFSETAFGRRCGCSDVGLDGYVHSHEARQGRAESTDEEGDRCSPTYANSICACYIPIAIDIGLGQKAQQYGDEHSSHHGQNSYGDVLASHEGHRSLENPIGDVLHLRGTFVFSEHVPYQEGSESDRYHCCYWD
jgi:hypothetical protein